MLQKRLALWCLSSELPPRNPLGGPTAISTPMVLWRGSSMETAYTISTSSWKVGYGMVGGDVGDVVALFSQWKYGIQLICLWRARCTPSLSHNCRWTQRCCESGFTCYQKNNRRAGILFWWSLREQHGTTVKKVGDNSFFQSDVDESSITEVRQSKKFSVLPCDCTGQCCFIYSSQKWWICFVFTIIGYRIHYVLSGTWFVPETTWNFACLLWERYCP